MVSPRDKAGNTEEEETKSQHEASHLKLQGWPGADRVRSCNTRVNICIYNTGTLQMMTLSDLLKN